MPNSRRQTKRKSKEEIATTEPKISKSKIVESSAMPDDDAPLIIKETEEMNKITLGVGDTLKSDNSETNFDPLNNETLSKCDIQTGEVHTLMEQCMTNSDQKDMMNNKENYHIGDTETSKLVEDVSFLSDNSVKAMKNVREGDDMNTEEESYSSITTTARVFHSMINCEPEQNTTIMEIDENKEISKAEEESSKSNSLPQLYNLIERTKFDEDQQKMFQTKCTGSIDHNEYDNMSGQELESQPSSLGFDVSDVQEVPQSKNEISQTISETDRSMDGQGSCIIQNQNNENEIENIVSEDDCENIFNMSTQAFLKDKETYNPHVGLLLKNMPSLIEQHIQKVNSVSHTDVTSSASGQIHTGPINDNFINNPLTPHQSNCDDLQTNDISDSQLYNAFHQTELEQKWDETHAAVMGEIQKKRQSTVMLDMILGELRYVNRQVMKFKQEMEFMKRKLSSNPNSTVGAILLSKSSTPRQTHKSGTNKYNANTPGGSRSRQNAS